jgi:hypothetical protein
MRTAEQGVVASALPGGPSGFGGAGGLFSSLGNFGASPTPPGAIPNGTQARAPQQQQSRGLDGWLLDSLFGR